MTKIGIYPGAFDPVHKGHLAFAKAAQKKLGLDKVYFLPEPSPRHKQGVKAFEHRINMVQLATANEPDFGVIVLDLQEFDVPRVWSNITARFLGSDLYMLIGSNAVKRLAAWPHTIQTGKQVPTFIIASREVTDETMITLMKTKKIKFPYEILKTDYEIFRSSDIRIKIKHGEKPDGLPHEVLEYIKLNQLYHA